MYIPLFLLSRKFIVAMENHITSDKDLVGTFLTNLRSRYKPVLVPDKQHQASEEKTSLGIIDEVSVCLSILLLECTALDAKK